MGGVGAEELKEELGPEKLSGLEILPLTATPQGERQRTAAQLCQLSGLVVGRKRSVIRAHHINRTRFVHRLLPQIPKFVLNFARKVKLDWNLQTHSEA